MPFAIGYQLPDPDDRDTIVDVVGDYRASIGEVYFAWVGSASGRSEVATRDGCTDWSAQGRMEDDLRALRQMGVKLDLLLNANCYGDDAIGTRFENQIGSLIDHLGRAVGGVEVVTTTSPFVARCVKKHFPGVEVRASVNMRIGSASAMSLMSDLFDSFYVQRDVQRNLAHLGRLRSWADRHGKKLCVLANSGCFHLCPGQTFHDNLVAHESRISQSQNVTDWNPILCWRTLKDRSRWANVLQSTWIRPEDLHRYAGPDDTVKLATRMHARPRMVVDAYASGRFHGNVLDLLEPAYSPAFAPHLIDNDRFPADWFERTSTCDHDCESCGFCAGVLERVLVKMEEGPSEVNADLEAEAMAPAEGGPEGVVRLTVGRT